MRPRLWGYIVLATAMLASCSFSGRKSTPRSAQQAYTSQRFLSEASVPLLYTEGIKSVLMGADTSLSASLFRRALELDSTHAPSWYELAMLYREEPEKAIPYSRKACLLDSTNVWYGSQLGQLMIGAKQYDSALRVYSSLMKLSSDNPDIYFRLAALYEMQGQPFQAIALLDSAETRFGILEQLSGMKRQLLMNVKLYDKALKETNSLIANFPYDETNYVALAEIYANMGKDSLARNAYQTALELNPNSIPTLISMNEYYKNTGDNLSFLSSAKKLMLSDEIPLETKILFYKEITQSRDFYRDFFFPISDLIGSLAIKYPDEYRITELYASNLIAGGNLEEALKLYKNHLITKGKPNRDAFNEVLNIEAYLQRPDSLAKYSALALNYYPSDPQLYIRKGSVLAFFMKDYPAAETEYLHALKYAQEDTLRSSIYGMLGDNRQNMGDSRSSFKYYQKALRCDTTNAVVYNNYAYYLSVLGQELDLAEEMAAKANRLEPGNATYLDTQAWVYFKQGRYTEAKNLMQQAMGLDGNSSAELMVHYGDILHALDDQFMATFYWKKALDKGYDAKEIEKRLKSVEQP